jgi:hypothetical protein
LKTHNKHEINSTRTKAAAKNTTKQTTLVLSPYLPTTKVKKMLKPWQAPLNKAPSKEGTEEQREREKLSQKSKTQSGSQGRKGTSMFQSP